MIRKSVVFLVDRYDRNVTMFRGYGGFYLITTYFRPFLLFWSSFSRRSNCAAGEVAREITCVTVLICDFYPSSSHAAKLEQRGVKKKKTVRGEIYFLQSGFCSKSSQKKFPLGPEGKVFIADKGLPPFRKQSSDNCIMRMMTSW